MGIYSKGFASKRFNHTPVDKYVHPSHISGFCTAEEGAQIVDYLKNYSGTFPLMADFSARFKQPGGWTKTGLSPKQWGVVRNSMLRDQKAALAVNKPEFKRVEFDKPIPITINMSAAFSHFKRKLGLKYAVFTLNVHSIEGVTPSRNNKYFRLKLRVSPNADGTVSVCRMCGRSLTDHTSIATGIGPYCAKSVGHHKLYKQDVTKFMSAIKKEFDKIGITEIEIWDASIVDNVKPIMNAIDDTPPSPNKFVAKPIESIYCNVDIKQIEWDQVGRKFVIDKSMMHVEGVKEIYEAIANTDNIVYVNIKNNTTGEWGTYVRLSHNQSMSTLSDGSMVVILKSLDDDTKISDIRLIVKL